MGIGLGFYARPERTYPCHFRDPRPSPASAHPPPHTRALPLFQSVHSFSISLFFHCNIWLMKPGNESCQISPSLDFADLRLKFKLPWSLTCLGGIQFLEVPPSTLVPGWTSQPPHPQP